MKKLLILIAAVVLLGCGEPQQSTPTTETKPVDPGAEVPEQLLSPLKLKPIETVTEVTRLEPPTPKTPDILIQEAAFHGDIKAVKQHLAAGTHVNTKDEHGETALHLAAWQGQVEIAKFLISKSANVNAKDDKGVAPLHPAAYGGHHDMVDLLIKNGANVNAQDNINGIPLHPASAGGHKETVKLLIANGADVNARDRSGGTPLMEAVFAGHKEIAELLIANGADVNAKTNDEITLLDAANHPNNPNNNKKEIAELLRKHGGKTAEELKAAGN